jgi:hypothetical protein
MKKLTDSEKIKLGNHWARILKLKRSQVDPNQFLTTWGDKTPLDLYATITRLVVDQTKMLNIL